MSHTIRHMILLLLFLLTVFSALGQSVGEKQSVVREKYPDIDLYYRWQEKEAQNETYRRTYEAWMTNGEKDVLKTTPVQNSLISKIDSLSHAFSEKFELTQDYEKAFYIGLLLEEKLSQAKEIQHPTVRRAYYKLGEAYYLFLDFHKSISLLENALSHVPSDFDDQTNFEALNIIGICYANIGEMETSDEYFRATLLSNDIVLNRPIYNAYALSHLACNAMMMKQYNKALALSEIAWSFLRKETEDYGHLAGMCYCRGRSFLETVDFQQASLWIDSLAYFAPQDHTTSSNVLNNPISFVLTTMPPWAIYILPSNTTIHWWTFIANRKNCIFCNMLPVQWNNTKGRNLPQNLNNYKQAICGLLPYR